MPLLVEPRQRRLALHGRLPRAAQHVEAGSQGRAALRLDDPPQVGREPDRALLRPGFDHVHARVDPRRYERQVRIFHEIIEFERLGVAFEDSVNGRSYAAIDVVERLSEERGFQVIRCYTKSDIPDISVAENSVIACFEQLVNKVDAIYVTEQGGVTRRSIPELVEIANRHKIPTFSQAGAEEVQFGVLTSLSQAGFRYVGEFHAETFAMVFNGAKPNQLEQLFEEPPKIAINLGTAELIGCDPPLVLLGAADEVFDTIAVPR